MKLSRRDSHDQKIFDLLEARTSIPAGRGYPRHPFSDSIVLGASWTTFDDHVGAAMDDQSTPIQGTTVED